jgi:DNA (cytosine-5)-methyltransferase 1
MRAYYNEHDPKAAAWLRELISRGLIAPGEVDERSIADVQASELVGFTQCHFFAGIGGWSYALRLAGWADERPVWTGSCPCQPFSVGTTDAAQGTCDSRDLWPTFFELIRECRPSVVFGEQVKNAIGWGWWDRCKLDLETIGYAAAAAVMRADTHRARHQRKRLYWLAHASSAGRSGCVEVSGVPFAAPASFAKYGDPISRSGRALDGDWSDLLHSDGIPVGVVRSALKGFGNAIVPQVASEFIQAAVDSL